MLAGKHRVAPTFHADARGERDERVNGLLREPVLRVVKTELTRFDCHPTPALGIVAEEAAQMGISVPAALLGEPFPFRRSHRVHRFDHGRISSWPPKAFRCADSNLSANDDAPWDPKRA